MVEPSVENQESGIANVRIGPNVLLSAAVGPFCPIEPRSRGAAPTVGCVTIMRPDPLRRLWYAYGGGLAPRYREWVLFDATCRTWWYESVEHRV